MCRNFHVKNFRINSDILDPGLIHLKRTHFLQYTVWCHRLCHSDLIFKFTQNKYRLKIKKKKRRKYESRQNNVTSFLNPNNIQGV